MDDIIQDVFLKAMKGLEQFHGDASYRTWLISIARNTAIDFERKKNRSLKKLFSIHRDELEHRKVKTPDEVMQFDEEIAALYSMLNELKPSYRDVVILRGIRDYTVKETADILQWSEAKVNLTMHRAIKKLQQMNEQRGGTLNG